MGFRNLLEKLENIFFSNFAIFSGHNRGDDNDERFQEITAQANIEVNFGHTDSKVLGHFAKLFMEKLKSKILRPMNMTRSMKSRSELFRLSQSSIITLAFAVL